nr:hypothetical protein GCM10025699_39120 [Microbacterium flavescens]
MPIREERSTAVVFDGAKMPDLSEAGNLAEKLFATATMHYWPTAGKIYLANGLLPTQTWR